MTFRLTTFVTDRNVATTGNILGFRQLKLTMGQLNRPIARLPLTDWPMLYRCAMSGLEALTCRRYCSISLLLW